MNEEEKPIRLIGKITVRNYEMIEARNKLGWTQKDVSDLCEGVGVMDVGLLEKMDFSIPRAVEKAIKIAEILGIEVSKIIPEDLEGMDMNMDKTSIRDISPTALLSQMKHEVLSITQGREEDMTPFESVENKDTIEKLIKHANLTKRQHEVVKDTYGLEGREILTLEKQGKKHKVTRERIRQLQQYSMRKLQSASAIHYQKKDKIKVSIRDGEGFNEPRNYRGETIL